MGVILSIIAPSFPPPSLPLPPPPKFQISYQNMSWNPRTACTYPSRG